MKRVPDNGRTAAANGFKVTQNPHPFETAEHYRWLADWHLYFADNVGVRLTVRDRDRYRNLGEMYRRQAAGVSLAAIQAGDGA